MKLKRSTALPGLVSVLAVAAGMAMADGHLPLVELPDDGERDYWLPSQVNTPGALEALQAVTGEPAQQYSGMLDAPIQIALIYPSADTSDFWARNYLAMTRRLDELGIDYETTEFASRQVEHSLQATYASQVDQDADIYDFVIFGPSELATQADNIDKLAGNPGLKTFVWAFHTPLQYLENQPDNWFDFSSSLGASVMCDYMLERLGNDVTFAMNRGIPGITDNQRSGEWADCVQERGNWTLAYEHYGEYTTEGGFEGTQLILQAYPEAGIIHNANTAMAMGSVQAQIAVDAAGSVFSTGWGGTGIELDSIRRGELDATPMRMGDDVGAATAEAIKYHLEGREAELPFVFLGRITIAHDQMSEDELAALEQEAFRFSGIEPLER